MGMYASLATLWLRQRTDVRRRSPSAAFPFQVLARISDLAVIAGEARPTQIAAALAWAQTHQEMLALKWAELNERG